MDIFIWSSDSDFESRHILELRGELEAWRNRYEHAHFESSQISEYVELKQNAQGHEGREEYPGMHRNAQNSPIACELNSGFVGCYFRNETDANDANLFFVTAYKREHLDRRSVYEFGGDTRTIYTLRQLSKKPTWNLHVCREDAFQCDVRIRLVQIASLDSFEAQLNRLAGMIEDVEAETVRLLKLKDREAKDQENEPRAQEAKRDSIPLRPYEFADFAYKPSFDTEEGPDENNQEAQDEPIEEDGYRDEL